MKQQLKSVLLLMLLATAAQSPLAPVAISVEEFRAAPLTQVKPRISGFAIDFYVCPPCPPHAMCKSCSIPPSIVIADAPARPGFSPQPTLRLETDTPRRFAKGAAYIFTIQALNPAAGVAGRILDSQSIARSSGARYHC